MTFWVTLWVTYDEEMPSLENRKDYKTNIFNGLRTNILRKSGAPVEMNLGLKFTLQTIEIKENINLFVFSRVTSWYTSWVTYCVLNNYIILYFLPFVKR